VISLDSRYKIGRDAMVEIGDGREWIARGYPFFIDLDDEAYKIPWAVEAGGQA